MSNLAALAALRQPNGRRPGLLALDVSKRAIGVAGADPSWRLATPLRELRRRSWAHDLASLQALIAEREAGALVIGWPLNMDGSEGPRCQAVRQFARDLDAALALPLLLWDERLTTFAATELQAELAAAGQRQRHSLDELAACAILQDLLDQIVCPLPGSAGHSVT